MLETMKRLVFQVLILTSAVFFFSFSLANGADFTINDNANLPFGHSILSNIYLASRSAKLESDFQKDLLSLSFRNVFDGNAQEDVILVGGNNDVFGKISGDLRMIGGVNSIHGEVDGDLLVIGAKAIIEKDAKISGDVFVIAGEFFSEADLDTNKVKIVAVTSNINSKIVGPIEITSQKIYFGDNAELISKLDYYSPISYEVSKNAKILGPVDFHRIPTWNETSTFKSTFLSLVSFWMILKLVTAIFLAFILVYAFRVFTQVVIEETSMHLTRSLLWGLAFAICAPALAIFFIVSLIAFPVGLILILFGIYLLLIAPVFAGILAGFFLKKMYFSIKKINKKNEISFGFSVLGILVLAAIQLIPYFGDAFKILLSLIAGGALVTYYLNLIFSRKN